MFIDEAIIFIRSGKGGDGAVHFRREKYVPRGGPDGGNGGHGGDVIFEVRPTLNTLSFFQHKKKFIADNGKNGAKQNQTGASADPLVIPVPPGTVVFDAANGDLLGDLTSSGQHLLIARGGRGGRGNLRFTTSTNQAPRIGEHGAPGQEKKLRLELKLIADIGIVGIPNAGKSTLLAAVTSAKPKIAPYPFTTLEPNLGVATLDQNNQGFGTSLILADIPGLIEGAHLGIGLGHDFLRHIQRTRVLIHLLDGASEDPLLDFAQINSELALFDPALSKKPQVVGFNKVDLPDVRNKWPKVERQLKKRGFPGYAISALTGENIRPLLYHAYRLLNETPVIPEEAAEMPVYRPESDPGEFKITSEKNGYRINGKAIERAAAMTYWEYDQSVNRFQRILKALGIEEALRKVGIQNGDTVYIGEYELEWQD